MFTFSLNLGITAHRGEYTEEQEFKKNNLDQKKFFLKVGLATIFTTEQDLVFYNCSYTYFFNKPGP